MTLKFGDLPSSPEPHVALYCLVCRDMFSADRGDYCMRNDEEVIDHCGSPMQLVRELPTAHEVLSE